MTFESPRCGVLIVRVWVEPSSPRPRARVTEIEDVTSPAERARVSADPDEIAAWARAFVARFGVTSE